MRGKKAIKKSEAAGSRTRQFRQRRQEPIQEATMAEITTDQDVQEYEVPLVADLLARLVEQAYDGETPEGGAWLSPMEEENENRVVDTQEGGPAWFVVVTDTGMKYRVQVTPVQPAEAQPLRQETAPGFDAEGNRLYATTGEQGAFCGDQGANCRNTTECAYHEAKGS